MLLIKRLTALILALLVGLPGATLLAASEARQEKDGDKISDEEAMEVRSEVADFFSDLKNPDVLAGLAKLPEGAVQTLASGGLDELRLARLEDFRAQMTGLFTALRSVRGPNGPLASQSDIDRAVSAIEMATPAQLLVLSENLEADPAWGAVRARLTPEIERDLRILGRQISQFRADPALADNFKNELVAWFDRYEGSGEALEARVMLDRLTPEELALVRGKLDQVPGWRVAPMLRTHAEQLQRALAPDFGTDLTPAQKEQLERFREDLAAQAPLSQRAEARETIGRLDQRQLYVYNRLVQEAPQGSRNDIRQIIVRNNIVNEPTVQALIGSCFGTDSFDVCPGPLDCDITIPTIDIPCIGSEFGKVLDDIAELFQGIADIFIEIAKLFDPQQLITSVLSTLSTVGTNLALGAFDAIGDAVSAIDGALGGAVLALRQFADKVKQPFIDTINAAGDPAAQSELLTQLDLFLWNRDTASGPLGIVPCMEDVLCADFDPVLNTCREGLTIPLVGKIGSDRSVFACMVIKNEVAYYKDLMPEDTLPGGKLADIALTTYVHKLDQLCSINDYMAGSRKMVEDHEKLQLQSSRFDRLFGAGCTLMDDGTGGKTLQCPDLPAGQSIAGLTVATNAQVFATLDTPVSTRASQASVDMLGQEVDNDLMNIQSQIDALQEEQTRLPIEADLRTPEPGVSRYMLPSAHGGYLEVVREIVLETIMNTLDAGQQVNKAEMKFDLAESAFSHGWYRRAYELYGEAYRQAVRNADDGT